MYSYEYSGRLEKILKKLSKKNKQLYEQILKKVKEIINSSNIEHYKNLKYDMKDYKEVHIGHFVLVFGFDKNDNKVLFDDFDHHDKIFKR